MQHVPDPAATAASLQSVERVTQILLTVAESRQPLGVSDLARHTGLAKSLVFRVLTSLVAAGLLCKGHDTRYRLGPRAAEIGLAALRFPDVVGVSMHHMHDLSRHTQETITLTLRVANERTYAAQVVSQQDVRKTVKTGELLPLYAGNAGRAMLAFFSPDELDGYLASVELAPLTAATVCDPVLLRWTLAEVRTVGYAVSHGERDPWSAGVGAPIFDGSGRVIAAISVCAPIGRLSAEKCREYGPLVKAAAARVTADLGGSIPRWTVAEERRRPVDKRQVQEVPV